MLALSFIRENADLVRRHARDKNIDAEIVDRVVDLDVRHRALLQETESRRAEQNALSKRVGPAIGKARAEGRPLDTIPEVADLERLKSELRDYEERVGAVERELDQALLNVPNIHAPEVPVAPDESGNVTARTWGEPPSFDFPPKPHYEIGEALGIMDFERATKVAGSRFAFLVGAGARLERALAQFMLDTHTRKHGYVEVQPPFLVNRAAMYGTANLPKFGDDAFLVEKQDMFLIPTAEVPVTNMYREEILDAERLPIRHVAFSPCFRSEAGAAGRDTRGYIRLHQFNKVEMVKFTTPETSLDELDALTADAEAILQALGLHYRVLLMCSGDMGFAQYKKYDLEAWAPGLGKYLEVSSCSNFQDFQARRANIRFRPEAGAKPRFAHTLNGSGLALVRTVSAILETYQQADGSVVVPEVLRGYLGGEERITA
ncbi:MAG TPA: serine--tRNA ligase [Candidatus Dormibacteraeota bacterium]|jgi:seryl-tRNA synthetase|nr:serine--tRNA ligase [Candidatus Dormibacteraeota bacterium]